MQKPTVSSDMPQQQQHPQPAAKFFARIPPRWRIVLGISVIMLMVVFAFIRPLERDPEAPVTITNLLQSVNMQHELDFQGVHMTIKKALLASKFSDDSKRAGMFTVRVEVQTKNTTGHPIGIDYAKRVLLVMPDGQTIAPKLVSILPMQMPESPQSGFFDYPVSTQVDVATLTLRFDDGQMIALK